MYSSLKCRTVSIVHTQYCIITYNCLKRRVNIFYIKINSPNITVYCYCTKSNPKKTVSQAKSFSITQKRAHTDGVHWHLLRCIGGQFLGSAFLCWRCTLNPSTAPAAAGDHRGCMRTACLLLRLLANVLSAFVCEHTLAMHSEFFHTGN